MRIVVMVHHNQNMCGHSFCFSFGQETAKQRQLQRSIESELDDNAYEIGFNEGYQQCTDDREKELLEIEACLFLFVVSSSSYAQSVPQTHACHACFVLLQ